MPCEDHTMLLELPDPSLVVLVGPSGSGKSTFARRLFRATEILSSDFFRGLVSNDESNQEASADAFEVQHLIAGRRLARRLLTVLDATHVKAVSRKNALGLARHHHVPAVALVFDYSEEVYQRHNRQRSDRQVADYVVRQHVRQLRDAVTALAREPFYAVHRFTAPEQADAARLVRCRLPWDRRALSGPFDLIGDVHGCFAELATLLGRLGYVLSPRADTVGRTNWAVQAPAGRQAVFVGDLVDRGPAVPEVLRLVMDMVDAGVAHCVVGNHDDKLLRRLQGRAVAVAHGLAETLAQFEAEPPEFVARVRTFLEGLPDHLLLADGRLVVAHAGLRADLQGGMSKRVRAFALYGATSGVLDEDGLPVRGNWAGSYNGRAAVVYGHTPVAEPVWVEKTLNLDTGCVFGGRLTALRWPEGELVSVPAAQVYATPRRPFLERPAHGSPPAAADP
jgi:protein phosphatase